MRMRKRTVALLASSLVAVAVPAASADWKVIRRDPNASLSIDSKSVQRKGDEVAFQFLIDLRTAQGDLKEGPQHRSIVTQGRVRCKARTIALGESEVFITNRAQGPASGRSDPKAATGRFTPLEKGSSDEDLWRHFCAPKDAKAAK